MFQNLVFYNYYGNGDLFNSREFIKELMEKIPAKKYIYCHSKNPRMFEDIPNLESRRMMSWVDNSKSFVRANNDLAINTWIGRDGRYVLPGIGCTIQQNIHMYNEILKLADLDIAMTRDGHDYIPEVNWLKLNHDYLGNISKFVKETPKRRVLWTNGHVQSMQAENFSFEPAISRIAVDNPDIQFIVTERSDSLLRPNVYYTGDIIKRDDGFDLNEIAYLSMFCDTFVGRPAGPFVFAQHKTNMYDNKKAILGFSHHPNSLTFALVFKTPIQKYWSNHTDTETITKNIQEVIDR